MPTRLVYLIGFFLITALLVTSLYLQFYDGIMPCPLCSLQRLTFLTLGILFFFGFLLYSIKWLRIPINFLITITSLLGVCLAGRQIWLQHYPLANNTECGASLQYMMKVLPVNEVLRKVFAGSAECTQRGWEFLHLNMAEWSLVWFLLFLILSVYVIFQGKKK